MYISYTIIMNVVGDKASVFTIFNNKGINNRIVAWNTFTNTYLKSPIIGAYHIQYLNEGNYSLFNNHNSFLNVLVAYGPAPTFLLLWLFSDLALQISSFTDSINRTKIAFAKCLFLSFFVSGMFEGSIIGGFGNLFVITFLSFLLLPQLFTKSQKDILLNNDNANTLFSIEI